MYCICGFIGDYFCVTVFSIGLFYVLDLIVAAPGAGQATVNCTTPSLPSPTMPTYTMALPANGQNSEAVYTNGIHQYTGEYGKYNIYCTCMHIPFTTTTISPNATL